MCPSCFSVGEVNANVQSSSAGFRGVTRVADWFLCPNIGGSETPAVVPASRHNQALNIHIYYI